MQFTSEQVKGRIKNIARKNNADPRTLMRIYMMERFLERVALLQPRHCGLLLVNPLTFPQNLNFLTCP